MTHVKPQIRAYWTVYGLTVTGSVHSLRGVDFAARECLYSRKVDFTEQEWLYSKKVDLTERESLYRYDRTGRCAG